jgi:hypothetical protein
VSNCHFTTHASVVTDSGCGRARECDERTAAEIESSHTTGVLKNHRNDAYTRMSQNLTRINTSQRKQAEACERKAAVDEIENEITMLTKSHQETRDRIKSLKASKTDICKRKSSSKAESNSSGRVRSTTISSSAKAKMTKAAKVTKAAKFGSKKCTLLPFPCCFQVYLVLFQQQYQLKSESIRGRIQVPHRSS